MGEGGGFSGGGKKIKKILKNYCIFAFYMIKYPYDCKCALCMGGFNNRNLKGNLK